MVCKAVISRALRHRKLSECRASFEHCRRLYASVSVAERSDAQDTASAVDASTAAIPQPFYRIRTGVVISRAPVITRDLHPFEQAYYLYQKRLNERLALPFTRYFYFKKGTPGDLDWKQKIKRRQTPARDIGVYNAYGQEGWNDEALVGAVEGRTDNQVEALLRDAEMITTVSAPSTESSQPPSEGALVKKHTESRPMSRTTEADQQSDWRSLDRKLQRTLYLLVLDQQGRWVFPNSALSSHESLEAAAERTLHESIGANLNTWVIGHAPIGHVATDYDHLRIESRNASVDIGEKTFFMKARVMAGQADLAAGKQGLKDFRWLTKEEIQSLVTPRYWSHAADMLSNR